MKIVVVQNHPTQFDAPLYALLHKQPFVELTVFYTNGTKRGESAVDSESSVAPHWDHLQGLTYIDRYEVSAFRLWRKILFFGADYVVICGWYPRSHALLSILLRLSGVRIGIRSDNTLEHTQLSGWSGLKRRIAMYFWLPIYHAWHPVGSLARNYVQALSSIQRPIFYFPYAVDVAWMRSLAEQHRSRRSKMRQVLGLSDTDYVVLGIMKWSDREDPLTLVDAVLNASLNVKNIRLLLVGDGPLRTTIEARISSSSGFMVAPGYVKYSELSLYYGVSDIFVHPAVSEPYGVSVQEALACGLPVLASSGVGAAIDFIQPGRNGDIFLSRDVVGLSKLLVAYSAMIGDAHLKRLAIHAATKWSYRRTLGEIRRYLETIP